MNKKAQIAGIATFIALFVGIVVATSLLSGGIYSNISKVTNTIDVVNASEVWGTTVLLEGQAVSNVIVINASSGFVVPASNYTITNYDVTTGSLRTFLTNRSGYVLGGTAVNVSYTHEPLGYSTSAGTRSVTLMIAIFASIAIIAVVIKKIYDDGLFDFF